MVRLKIRKRIARLSRKAKERMEAGDTKKAAELLLRINECEEILKML